MREFEEAVDVAARTDNLRTRILLGVPLQHLTHRGKLLLTHRSGKHTQCTHIERVALGKNAVMQKRNLRTATADVDISIVAYPTVGVLHKVVAEQLRLSRTGYNLKAYARMLLNALHHLAPVLGVAHSRSGASAILLHIVKQHELAERLHHVEHHVLTLLRDLAEREHILAKTQRNAHKQQFRNLHLTSLDVWVETLYQQSGSVRADVNSRNVHHIAL